MLSFSPTLVSRITGMVFHSLFFLISSSISTPPITGIRMSSKIRSTRLFFRFGKSFFRHSFKFFKRREALENFQKSILFHHDHSLLPGRFLNFFLIDVTSQKIRYRLINVQYFKYPDSSFHPAISAFWTSFAFIYFYSFRQIDIFLFFRRKMAENFFDFFFYRLVNLYFLLAIYAYFSHQSLGSYRAQ